VGEGFRVCVTGFQPGKVEVTLSPRGGGNPVRRTAVVDADGVGSIAETILPGGEVGAYRVRAVETLEPAEEAEATITVIRILVEPPEGPPGVTFTVALDGFRPGSRVTLHLYGPEAERSFPYATKLPPVPIDANGAGTEALTSKTDDRPGTYCLAFADYQDCERRIHLG
jgi:hypothetical protein